MTDLAPTGTSHELRSSASAEWRTATSHRLFREIVTDTVEDDVFERYLRIEYGFIDTAAAALGAAVARAPGIGDRTVLVEGLHELLTSQVEFFLEALGPDVTALVPQMSGELHLHFDSATRTGDYGELLVTMLGAEWLYEAWCDQTRASASSRQTIRAWTELHTDRTFTDHVAWLRDKIDTTEPAATIAPARKARLAAMFRRTLHAEVRFHDAAYED